MRNKIIVELSKESARELIALSGSRKPLPPASSFDPFGLSLLTGGVGMLTHSLLGLLEKAVHHYVCALFRDKHKQLKHQFA